MRIPFLLGCFIANTFLLSAIASDTCGPLFNDYTEVRAILGEGAGGKVFLITYGSKQFVEKVYNNDKEYSNDLAALVFLLQLQASRSIHGFRVIDFETLPTSSATAHTARFEYHKGETLYDNLKRESASHFLAWYISALKDLDSALSRHPDLRRRSEFPLYDAPAIHYEFPTFQIVIHVKNVIVSENQLVLIDPH